MKKRRRKKLKSKIRKRKQLVHYIYSHMPCRICLVYPTCSARYIKNVEDHKKRYLTHSHCPYLKEYFHLFKEDKRVSPIEVEAMIYCILTKSNQQLIDQTVENFLREYWVGLYGKS
jgi:hypothetical protein